MLAGGPQADDAVVVQVRPGVCLVQTVDFFTPVVDDPYSYGRIAAANSLSDVYAMGGQPVTAMNICCFPTRSVGGEVLSEILRGGLDTVLEAGALLAGGHTVEDAEPKYGLAVTGLIEADQICTKAGYKPGQKLVLSKPIGTGILTTAQKREALDADSLALAIDWMQKLNRATSELMLAAGVRGATDITGYGLLGHGWECAKGSSARLVIEAERVPVMGRALEYLEQGHYPGGSRANRAWLEGAEALRFAEEVPELLRDLLADAQTSGGLLMGWPAEVEVPDDCWVIGHVEEGPPQVSVV